jgi:hypothetical protein
MEPKEKGKGSTCKSLPSIKMAVCRREVQSAGEGSGKVEFPPKSSISPRACGMEDGTGCPC